MDILSKYKMPSLGTIAMSPKSEEKLKAEPDNRQVLFRVCSTVRAGEISPDLGEPEERIRLHEAFHNASRRSTAKATADGTGEVSAEKVGWEIPRTEVYPTGSSDFSVGSLRPRQRVHSTLPVFDMPQSEHPGQAAELNEDPYNAGGLYFPNGGPRRLENL